MAADYEFDDQASWETGDFIGCAAVDPTGKLTPAVSPETLAELIANHNLSIYLRCREGTGTTIDNIATAGEDGTLTNADAWKTRSDGRHYLHGRSVTVSYFAGMKVVDDNDHSWSYAAQMRVRFASFSAQVLLQRNNGFKLGIDSTGHPYLQNYYHISEIDNEEHVLDVAQNEWWYLGHTTLGAGTFVMTGHSGAAYELNEADGKVKFTGGAFDGTVEVDYYHHEESGWTAEASCKDDDVLSLNEWHKLGIVCSRGYLSLYLDDDIVATLETYYSDNDPETDLVAACTDDWGDIMFAGEAESECLVHFPITGSWSKEIDLGADKTLRYLEIDTTFTKLEHGINITIAFADSAAELDYARTWSWTVRTTGTTTYFPPYLGLLHGTWMKISLSLTEKAYDRDAVLMDALRVWVRVPATVLYDYEQSPYSEVGIPEMGTPENLGALVGKVRALYAVTNELSREITEVRAYAERATPGISGIPDMGSYGQEEEEDWAAKISRMLDEHTRELWFWLPLMKKDHEHVGYLMQKTSFLDARRAVHWDYIMENRRGIASEVTALITHAALTTGVHGAGSDTLATDADIATHAALTVNTHGTGEGNYIAWTDQSDQRQVGVRALALINAGLENDAVIDVAIDSLIATHNAAAAAHDNGAGTSLYDHKILMSNVHGAAEGDPLMTLADTNTVVGNHESSATAHGSIESTYATHAADASAHHAKYTDGAVEVVITTNVGPAGIIDNAIDALISDHEASATAHGSIESVFATHAGAPAAHHSRYSTGEAEAVITAELEDGQSIDLAIDALISTHEGSATAHGSIESTYATHAGDASAHHTKYTDGAVETVITTNVGPAGIIDNAIDALINTHEGSGTAHGSVEFNFALHKDATTGIHGVGTDYIATSDNAGTDTIETQIADHADDTTGIHGVGGDYVAKRTGASGDVTVETMAYAKILDHQLDCTNYAS